MKNVKQIVLLCAFFCFAMSLAEAQQSRRERRSKEQALALFADSVTASAAEYMLHLETLYQKVDSIQSESRLSIDILMTGQKLKESDSILHFVNQNLSKYNHTLNLRNLQMFKILLEGTQHDLKRYNKSLKAADSGLVKLRTEIREVRRDSMLRHLIRDSVSRKKFLPQLKELRSKWRLTDSLVRHSVSTINTFKTQASAGSITTAQLLGRLNNQLNSAGKKIFSKELNYLWEPASIASLPVSEGLMEAYGEEQKALNFYFKDSSASRFFRWLTGILFFWWVYVNLRCLKRLGKTDSIKPYDITYLSAQPIAASFVVMLSLAPLFDLHAPAAYVQLVQFLLLIALTLLYRRQWPRTLFYYWLSTVVVFVLFTFTNQIIVPTVWQRLWMIALNAASAVLAVLFLSALPAKLQLRRFVKYVCILQLAMNVVAILCNVYGRLSLAQMLGITSIFAFTQVMGLSILVKALIEAMLLQIHTSRVKRGVENSFEFAGIVYNFRKPLLFVVVLIWFIVFTTNLNIYEAIFDGFTDFLATPREIGNLSFPLRSILLFFLIIWVAHFLQRYLGYFLGDLGDDEGESLAHRSKLLMTRLVLLSAGYLLAVAASGLPIDQITIVLGALGVGIGLGLQNIVNNFVSGIILIFDRPLKVGDSIEVGNHAGRVKEIGLRSSTLFTADGADVIIPNGDVLSQHIVNWTHSNNYKRIDLDLTINTSEDKDAVIAIIKEIIRSEEKVLKKREPVVLLDNIKDNVLKLKVFFWCEDVYKADQAKSEIRYEIYKEFKTRGIDLG